MYYVIGIIVFTLPLVCIVLIILLIKSRKQINNNSGNRMENNTHNKSFDQQAHYRDFTVLEKNSGQNIKPGGYFQTDEESSETVSIGVENSFGGGNNAFYGESRDDLNKTEMMFNDVNISSGPLPYGHSDGVTIQYQRNGILQNFRMTGQYALIGRDLGCDIIIDSDNYMSEQHAIVYAKNRTIYIADLNSKNGTYVNGSRIKGAVRLSAADNVKVASSGVKVIMN